MTHLLLGEAHTERSDHPWQCVHGRYPGPLDSRGVSTSASSSSLYARSSQSPHKNRIGTNSFTEEGAAMYGLRMTHFARRILSPRGRTTRAGLRRSCPRIEALEARLVLSSNTLFLQSNLVSDIQGAAQAFDPNLNDPWGLSFSKTGVFWISDQASNVSGSSVTTLYKVDGTTGVPSILPFFFGIPNLGGAPPDVGTTGPTGQVNTNAPGLRRARPIFRSTAKRRPSSSRTWTVRSRRGMEVHTRPS